MAAVVKKTTKKTWGYSSCAL